MANFRKQYRELFAHLGFPLSSRHEVAKSTLEKAANRLGVSIPTALYDYYRVAGNMHRFNRQDDELLPPSRWHINSRKLAFMQGDAQSHCDWGVNASSKQVQNPVVYWGYNLDSPTFWSSTQTKFPEFISLMIYRHSVYGGFAHTASASAILDIEERLRDDGWNFVIDQGPEWVFTKPEKVVFWDSSLQVGAKTRRGLDSIGSSLNINLY